MRRPLVRFLCVLALLLAVGILLSFRRSAPPPREVPANELVLRDGRSFWKDETVPFSGFIIEKYPNGALKSRSLMVDGRLNGASEGWFTNGVMQVREQFRDGVSHGLRQKWHPDGAKLSEATIENGQVHGTFIRWHEDGTIAEKVQMSHGQPDGESLVFFPSGSLKARVVMKDGKVVRQERWKEGEMNGSNLAKN